jgi:hypothetical protein
MRKMTIAIARAAILLLAGVFICNAEAATLSGIVGVQPSNALIEMVGCDKTDDPLCEPGKEISCTKGDAGPVCACLECDSGEKALCPNTSICAPRGTCKVCGGVWKCCMM